MLNYYDYLNTNMDVCRNRLFRHQLKNIKGNICACVGPVVIQYPKSRINSIPGYNEYYIYIMNNKNC